MTAMKPMDGFRLGWATGLFEGEGSMFPGKIRGSVVMALSSTDEDVVRRFHRVVGCGSVAGPFQDKAGKYKLHWDWRCNTISSVSLMEVMAPHFGVRRRERAEGLLALRQEYVDDCVAERKCPICEEVFSPPYSKMAFRRIYCSKECKWTATNRRQRGKSSRP